MPEPKKRLVGPKLWGFCLILTALFWLFMASLMFPIVPPTTPIWSTFWAGYTAAPIALTFYLASMCFCVTLVDQRRRSS